MDKTTEIEIVKADLAERGFSIKVNFSLLVDSIAPTRVKLTC